MFNLTFADSPTDTDREAEQTARAAISAATMPDSVPEGPERDAAAARWDTVWDDLAQIPGRPLLVEYAAMNGWRKAMDELGMLTGQDQPEWPRPGDFGLTEADLDDLWDHLDPDEKDDADGEPGHQGEDPLAEAKEQFKQAQAEATDAEPQPVTGIPHYKLCTPDGWQVTPGQIRAALAAWEAAEEQQRRAATEKHSGFAEWIAWIGQAKVRGGFRVS